MISGEIIVFILGIALIICCHRLIRTGRYRAPIETTGDPLYVTARWLLLPLLGLYGFTLTLFLTILEVLPEPGVDILGLLGSVLTLFGLLLEPRAGQHSAIQRMRITNIISFVLGGTIALMCASLFNNN